LPLIGKEPPKSTINPDVKKVLLNMERVNVSPRNDNSIKNDFINDATINEYTESAFKISEMRQKLRIYKEKRSRDKELER